MTETEVNLNLNKEFKSGITWRSMFALIYSLFIFTPAVIWLNLNVVGVGLGGSISLITLFIFAEIAAMYDSPLTEQECALILGPMTSAGFLGFMSLIYRAYFAKSPLLNIFNIDPSGIPTWWGPSHSSQAYYLRTLNHPDFVIPTVIMVISWLLGMGGAVFFAFLGRELFIEGEKLEFPIEQVTLMTITALAEREEDRMMILSWAGLISFLYGLILYTIPTYSTVAGFPVRVLPVPWFDATAALGEYLPGGAFGIATDLLILSWGIIVPTPLVLGIFIASVARFLVINPLLVAYRITEWGARWVPGMDFIRLYQDSTLYTWLSPAIGIGFATALVPIVLRWKTFIHSLRSAFKLRIDSSEIGERISGSPLSVLWMGMLSTTLVGAVIFDLYLVPGFPVLPLVLYEIVMPFIVLLAAGRMIGTAGVGFDLPYLRELTIMSGQVLGYTRIDAWFLPIGLNPGTDGWLQGLKVAQLTRTKASSWIIAAAISFPLAVVTGYLYTSLFWQIAPIPSDLYPAPAITWPIQIMHTGVWITRPQGFFEPVTMLIWFAGFSVLIAVTNFINVPFSMIGIAAGTGTPIPTATTMFIGMITGMIIVRIKGKAWLNKYRTTIAAGFGLGEGIAIVIGVVLALALKTMWVGRF